MAAYEPTAIEYPCPHCGAVNRIPRPRLRDDPRCGQCKAKLFPHHSVTADDRSFGREVEDSPLPVLVDFWAPWCGPCRMVEPVVEEIARERGGRLKVVRVNLDDSPAVASRFRVSSIPTLKLFRDGHAVADMVGAVPKSRLELWIDSHVQI